MSISNFKFFSFFSLDLIAIIKSTPRYKYRGSYFGKTEEWILL